MKSVKLMKSHGVKIDSIVKHVILLLKEDSMAKILIFSQWEEVLKIVGNALKLQQVGWINLDGKGYSQIDGDFKLLQKNGALSRFKDFGSGVPCLMLHAKSQSSGLNLTEASHVFLVEPLLHKGLEQQAIGRINRIGQDKKTFVYRYLVEGSVELYMETCKNEDEQQPDVIGVSSSRGLGEIVSTDLLTDFFEPFFKLSDEDLNHSSPD